MTTKHKRFTPESIQQLKDTSRYLHSKSDPAAAGDDYKVTIESNLIELSNRIENVRKHRDTFIEQLNEDLEALENALHESLVTYTALTELHNNK